MIIDRIEIGRRLRELRKTRGLSSLDLSKEIGTSRSAIQMYEAGKRLPRDEIKTRLADFYKLSVDEMFFSPKTPRSCDSHIA